MPNKNYKTGYRFERREFLYQRSLGRYVIRNHGSHGPFDLMAYGSEGPVLLIEVKTFKKGKPPRYRETKTKMYKVLPHNPHVQRLIVVYGPRITGKPTKRTEIPLNAIP